MPPRSTGLPAAGPLPRPRAPAEARETLRAEAFEAPDVQRITMVGSEFTSICPRTGQPDFGTITIDYAPAGRCLESKSLKYYLWSYRDEEAFCESLAARIADDVVYAVAPKHVRVTVSQNVRGGIAIVAVAERSGEPGRGQGTE